MKSETLLVRKTHKAIRAAGCGNEDVCWLPGGVGLAARGEGVDVLSGRLEPAGLAALPVLPADDPQVVVRRRATAGVVSETPLVLDRLVLNGTPWTSPLVSLGPFMGR